MIGPFDAFTTLSVGDMWPALWGGPAGAADGAAAAAVNGRPAITAAAPATALRIMNARRSTPAGTSSGTISSAIGRFLSSGFIAFSCLSPVSRLVHQLADGSGDAPRASPPRQVQRIGLQGDTRRHDG